MNLADTRQALNLHLVGTLITTTVFDRIMAEKGKGVIVNISSLSIKKALTHVLGYTMAKTDIEDYTKYMASELDLRYNGRIRMNALAPSVFITEQNTALLLNPDGSYTNRAQNFINNMPYARFGKPDELTGALIYLSFK